MSSFADSFAQGDDDSHTADPVHQFDEGYLGFQSSSHGFDSLSTFTDNVSVKDSLDDSPVFNNSSSVPPNIAFGPPLVADSSSPTGIYSPSAAFASDPSEIPTTIPDANGKVFVDGGFGLPDGPVLPDLSEMQRDDGYALREWRRLNAIQLQEKENREKELLNNIINEAEAYKIEYYTKRRLDSENKKSINREREKLSLSNQVKFHEEASKNYWKAISELIPHEVAAVETRRSKKEQEKKTPVLMLQGPKSGKPTDLSRMRQLLSKLKHNTPPHLKPPPPPSPVDKGKDGKDIKKGEGSKDPSPAAAAVAAAAPNAPVSAALEGHVAA